MSTPEGRVKARVKKALDKLGVDCWRFMPVQTGFGAPALDFLLSVRGRFVAIETKAPGKKLTPLQETTKAAIEASGGIVLVVWDESTLAIAMKIILALEFAPYVAIPKFGSNDHLVACLKASRGGYEGGFTADKFCTEKDGLSAQYRRSVHAIQAFDAAASGHHGTPGATPKRRSK